MRANPWRWLWGLLPLAILTWLAVVAEHSRIEADLTSRTQSALKAEGVDRVLLDFSGRDGVLALPAINEVTPERATQIAGSVWGVRVVKTGGDRVQMVEDYIWQAETDGHLIRLAGYVPDEARRDSILALAKAKFPDRQIEDRMLIASGAPAPEPWLAMIGFGLDRLRQLKAGNVELHQLALAVAGEALTHAAYRSAQIAMTGGLPAGATLVSDKIIPPIVDPYTWGAEKTASQLVLTGYVPDLDARENLFDKAKTTFPKLAIIDRMEIAGGAGDGWIEAALAVLDSLRSLNQGDAKAVAGDIVLRGQATDEASAAHVSAALKAALPQTFKARTELTFPPPAPLIVSPFTTGIEVKPAAINFTGYVPGDTARTALISQAAKLFPNFKMVDQMALGGGAPEGWEPCLFAGLEALARLGNGAASLSDRTLELHGRTQDEALAEALPAQVRTAANRACESQVAIALDVAPEPHLTWSAANTGNGEIVLAGQVPDKASEALLIDTANSLFPGIRIETRMTVTSGRPDKWQKVAVIGLRSLAKLRRGEVIIDGQDLTVSGEAGDSAIAAAIKDQLSHALAKGYVGHDAVQVRSEAMIWADKEAERKVAEEDAHRHAHEAARAKQEAQRAADEEARKQTEAPQIAAEAGRQAAQQAKEQSEEEAARRAADGTASERPTEGNGTSSAAAPAPSVSQNQDRQERIVEADRCEQRLTDAAATGTIRFDFDSAHLESASTGTLNRLAEIAKGCPGFRIEIRGHADSIGRDDRNQRISEARARVVADYLISAGVDADRLRTVGYGNTRPMVPNSSAANRARNRRIEFSVTVD